MITIDFSKRNGKALFEFIYLTIKEQISCGNLKANEKLPSKRALANHLGVSLITVQNAYALLISEGYIYSVEKKGFYITDIFSNSVLKKSAVFVDDKSESVVQKVFNNEEKKQDTLSNLIDLKSNQVSLDKFPFYIWARITRQILNLPNQNLLQAQNIFGVYELREAIAHYLYEFRNIKITPSQIVVGSGTESMYSILVQFLGQEKLYAVENPGYHKVKSVFEMNGAKCCLLNLDMQGICMEQLQKDMPQVLHISPAHHFPTGLVMPIKRRLELIDWLSQDKSRFIIEDDYDSEFRFNGKPLPPLLSLSPDQNIIYINTFSKTLAPSFRISYMVLPQKLISAFNEKLGFCTCQVSTLEQYVLSQFIKSGEYEKHLIRMKNYYRNLRDTLIKAIQNSTFSKLITIQEKDTGLHFLMTVKSAKSASEIQSLLLKNGINMPFLLDYFYSPDKNLNKTYENTFVINYTGLKKEQIPVLVNTLQKILAA